MSAADDASWAASVFAVDPPGLGGVCLRSAVQPARDQWLTLLSELLPDGTPLRRVPFNVPDGRLLGGLDLVATLKAKRPVAEQGILAGADGGVIVLAMAERLTAQSAARLAAVLDLAEVNVPREGVVMQTQARVGIVALDEGASPDEVTPSSLLDRFALLVDLNDFSARTLLAPMHDREQILEARQRYGQVKVSGALVSALCATAIALGAGSTRVSILALNAARAVAALDGRIDAQEADVVMAARLVLATRATRIPAAQEQTATPAQEQRTDETNIAEPTTPLPTPPSSQPTAETQNVSVSDEELAEVVLAAARAAIPNGILDTLRDAAVARGAGASAAGRVGALRNAGSRGRPCGIRHGAPRGGARLNLLETLRAAAPWQALRGARQARIQVMPEDFRVTRYQQRSLTLTIFTVDASGSSALNRLAEAKGAVELLLSECYIRRDQVAVIAFRGRTAEILLPPTRSLVRAKRGLAALPGGGGTPMAAALATSTIMARQAQRRGEAPTLVVLSDGRANVARDGAPGRERAHADALSAARALKLCGVGTIFVDTSPRPNELAKELALNMNARYVPLPYAAARTISDAVRAAKSPS